VPSEAQTQIALLLRRQRAFQTAGGQQGEGITSREARRIGAHAMMTITVTL